MGKKRVPVSGINYFCSGDLAHWDGELAALASVNDHVAFATIPNLTRHMNLKKPVTGALPDFTRQQVECRLQGRQRKWSPPSPASCSGKN